MSLRRLPALVVLVLCIVALPVQGQKNDEKKSKSPATLPGDAVIVVTEKFPEAMNIVPGTYVLTPEAYRKIQDELTRLRLLANTTSQTPSEVHLKGKVDGNLVHFTAVYKFRTDQNAVTVRLGGNPAQATGVSLDGKTPRLIAGRSNKGREEEGFSVHIDKPGEYTLTLDLVLPLTPRGAWQAFSLDLPRAAITEVQLELPPGSRDVRYAGKPLVGSGLSLKGNKLTGHPTANDRLEIEWKSAQAASAGAVFTAEGLVQVRLEKQEMTSKAELKLSVQSGQVKQYRLVLPLKSELAFDEADKARVRVEKEDKKQVSIHTIHLKEPSAEPLTVSVISRTDSPRPGGNRAALIGPFNVLGAVRQSGSVLISSGVAEWHIEPTPRGDLTRRAPTEEEFRKDTALVAAFRYGPGDGGARQSGLAWLEVEVENVSGQLAARLAHTLALVPVEAMAVGEEKPQTGMCWQTRTTMTVTPRRAGVSRFVVAMPPGCELKENSVVMPERVRSFHYDSSRRLLEFRLASAEGEALAPITVRFESNYPSLDPKAPCQATLILPRPLRMTEQQGSIRVEVPSSSFELIPPPTERIIGLELVRQTAHELSYRYPARRAPVALEVQWRPSRPVVRVESLIDLRMGVNHGHVHQKLNYLPPAGGLPATRLSLHVPDRVASNLRVKKGGQLLSVVAGLASIIPSGSTATALELEYSFALAESGQLNIPLVTPDGDYQGETRVRVWSEAGLLPSVPRGDWMEQGLEEVPGIERLPVLVLRSTHLDRPLVLHRNGAVASRVLVERALIEVGIDANGQSYTVSYRLGRFVGRQLQIDLPAPASAIGLKVALNGARVDFEEIPGDGSTLPGRRVQLRLSSGLVRPSSVLELRYHLTPDRPELEGRQLTTMLLPPRLCDDVTGAATRWLVTVPPDWVLLSPEPGAGSPLAWNWQRWLFRPRPQASVADLKAWFAGTDAPDETQAYPSLTMWREAQPLRLTYVNQQLWLIGCSLLLAVLGLGLFRLALSPRPNRAVWAWVLGGLVLLGLLILVVVMPTLAAQIAYGCQPGLVVLLVMIVLQWLMHERYRRRVVFLPSFSRARPGSSLARREIPRTHGEPSTVDVPQAIGSSAERRP